MFKAVQLIIGKFTSLPWLVLQLYIVPTAVGLTESHVECFDPNSMFVHLREVFSIVNLRLVGSHMFEAVQLIIGKFTALPLLVHQLYTVPTAVGLTEIHAEHLI